MFEHLFLDEIVAILYRHNPLGYALEREGSYESIGARLFSVAYANLPEPGSTVAPRALDALSREVRRLMEDERGDQRPRRTPDVFTAIAEDVYAAADEIESDLMEGHAFVQMADAFALGHDELVRDFADGSTKKWLN